MQIGIIGLGKMGGNMARRLMRDGHDVVGNNNTPEPIKTLEEEGATGAYSLQELADKLATPRVAWIMVPAGSVTEQVITQLTELFAPGDIIVDGGNSNYHETMRLAEMVAAKQMHLVDVGTSGGVWGLQEGYSMMVGGSHAAVAHITPVLQSLAPAPDKGWGHVGPSGAGHFVKMVHNGIEYGMMQAYAEGFELMGRKEELNLDLAQIAEIWRFGSVVRSWLLDLTAAALHENPTLDDIAAYVPDSGEGRWTVKESIDLGVPLPVITLALQNRFRSRSDEPMTDKLLSAMRNQFGGHAIKQRETR
jgi:6-phosphogluconate dehydrogenase